ncbi:MAG: hypothetical protein LBJ59_07150 [Zoogloeaceae bacterium]|nr:hypothetical protein [Zoogloeaceae bacterium]
MAKDLTEGANYARLGFCIRQSSQWRCRHGLSKRARKKGFAMAGMIAALVLSLCASYAVQSSVNEVNGKESDVMRFGKTINLEITKDEMVDFEHLQKVLDGKIKKSTPHFDLLNRDGLKELIEYMKTNNYVIVSGKYVFNQGWKFEKGDFITNSGERREIFRFIVKEREYAKPKEDQK